MRATGSAEQMAAVLTAALAAGMNHVETAPAYGMAERYLGLALRDLQERDPAAHADLVITSKLLPGLSLEEGQQQLRALLERLGQADMLVVAGEASSHCVRSTVEHLVEHLPYPERIVLMHDAMSPVPGFESAHHDFLAAMQARGLRLASSQELHL